MADEDGFRFEVIAGFLRKSGADEVLKKGQARARTGAFKCEARVGLRGRAHHGHLLKERAVVTGRFQASGFELRGDIIRRQGFAFSADAAPFQLIGGKILDVRADAIAGDVHTTLRHEQ